MEKDIVLCKDCMYNGIELCPMKKDWQNRPEGFCDVGQEKLKHEVGDLLVYDSDGDFPIGDYHAKYILIRKIERDIYSGDTVCLCQFTDGHPMCKINEEYLNDYKWVAKFEM